MMWPLWTLFLTVQGEVTLRAQTLDLSSHRHNSFIGQCVCSYCTGLVTDFAGLNQRPGDANDIP